MDATIKTAHVNQDRKVIDVEWIDDDQHTSSIFQLDWLTDRRFIGQDENRQPRIGQSLWNSETSHNIPRFEFNKVMTDGLQLYQCLRSILKHEPGQVRKLAN